jgi:hypothetical protein
MRVKTNNDFRTIEEMNDMWVWMVSTLGSPKAHGNKAKRWTYGKDNRGDPTDGIISGTFDIEWFDFREDADATVFLLRWAR